MSEKQRNVSARGTTITVFAILTAIVVKNAFITDERWYYFTLITVPILLFQLFGEQQE